MLFHSGSFLFFFAFFVFIYYQLQGQHRAKTLFVIAFSLFFYYKSSGFYFLLLVFSTIVDYFLAKAIWQEERKRKRLFILIISLLVNFGILAYFKYANFIGEIGFALLNQPFHKWDIFLPVGISFFTFQSMSYTIDVYRRSIRPISNLWDYAFFVSFFPQLLAGPIVRAKDFIPQIYRPTFVSQEMFGRGIFLIMSGLFKKAIISDYISINFVDRVFDQPTLYTGLENLFAIYGYALQIYCDFSGYSDMAIGIALLLGFQFPLNFHSPYQSASITEFWRRWHISLSTWLKDYLYISLGGNQKGKTRTYINLMITMLLGGLWHGASARFILWGGMHGLALIVEKNIAPFLPKKLPITAKIFRIFLTFHFVCFCWLFFRADNLYIVGEMLTQISQHFHPEILFPFIDGYAGVLWLMLMGYMLHFIPQYASDTLATEVMQLPLALKITLITLVIFGVIQIQSADVQAFIYFQF